MTKLGSFSLNSSMVQAELDDFMALNDQLGALVQAGVPLHAGVGKADRDFPRTLEKINAAVARRVSRGDSLEESLEDDDTAPDWYRAIVLSGTRGQDMNRALDASNRAAQSVDDSRYVAESSFIYPLIVCTLAYVGMVGFCLFFLPVLVSTYEALRIEPGIGLNVLKALRDTLPYWVAVPPAAILLFIAWRWWRRTGGTVSGHREGRLLRWLPGVSRSLFYARCASFAETLATLEHSDMPFEERLTLAARASGDASLTQSANSLAARIAKGKVSNDDRPPAMRFPPFLSWAILDSDTTIGRASALEMAGRVYRDAAERAAERSAIVTPILLTVLLGGGATLLYGLALFVPVVEMLSSLALDVVGQK